MKKYRWLFIFLGVATLGIAVIFGAALGAGITYFFLHAEPVQAAFTAPLGVDRGEGVLIATVEPGSAAAEAGLVRGDILLKVDGEPVNNLLELQVALTEATPGDTVELTVLHGDETRTLQAELGARGDVAYLGVDTCGAPLGNSMKNVTMNGIIMQGAEITEVVADSPAEAAGLQVGDLVVSVDGEEIGPKAGLADLIQAHEPGDRATLEVQSPEADETHEVEVTLGENPDNPELAYLGVAYQASIGHLEGGELPFMEMFPFGELPEGFEDSEGGSHFFFHHDGEEFEGERPKDWGSEGWEDGMPHSFEMPQLPEGVESAVIISDVMEDTPAEEAGLQPNDLVLAIDGKTVAEVEAFVETLQSHKPGDKVTLTVYRAGEEIEVQVTLAEHPDNPKKGFLGVMAGTFTINQNLELPEGFDQDFEFELPGASGGDA